MKHSGAAGRSQMRDLRNSFLVSIHTSDDIQLLNAGLTYGTISSYPLFEILL